MEQMDGRCGDIEKQIEQNEQSTTEKFKDTANSIEDLKKEKATIVQL
jgi:hypothetical protein